MAHRHTASTRRTPWLVVSGAIGLLGVAAAHGQETASAPPRALTLEEARTLAFERSPELRIRQADLAAAEADLVSAKTYPFNPELEASRTRRSGVDTESTDREIGLSQELEIAGQRGKRVATARAALDASQNTFERERQLLAALVETQFADALAARGLNELARYGLEIARELSAFEQRRFDGGASTVIDLNVARAAEARSARQLELARAAEAESLAALAATVGLAPAELASVTGALPGSWPDPPPVAELEAAALARRHDLVALRERLESASARIRLERSLAMPNVVVGIANGREDGTDDLDTVSVGLAIPLFQRNQGGIASAKAAESGDRARLAAGELDARREIASAHSAYVANVRALAALEHGLAGTLEENLELVQKSLAAGKMRPSEVLIFRREFLDGRRELIEAGAAAWRARILLDLATGALAAPSRPTASPTSEPPE